MDIDELFDCFTEVPPESLEPPTPGPSKAKSATDKAAKKAPKRPADDAAIGEKHEEQEQQQHEEVAEEEATKRLKKEEEVAGKKGEDAEEEDLEEVVPLDVDDSGTLEALNTRIVTHLLEAPESCTHEVAAYPDQEYIPLQPFAGIPAKEYPFVLDPFQRQAILCIDNSQSVLVSAHTSAGKTVVAEYAIAKSLAAKQRVIYTTPIKGPVQPEVPRVHRRVQGRRPGHRRRDHQSLGFVPHHDHRDPQEHAVPRQRDYARVGWVVFDEIHYMWVCHLHKQPCHVVYTDYRPTPLQHYIFPAGGDGIHLIVDEKGQFKEDNFTTAMAVLANAGEAGKGDQKGRKGGIKGHNSGQTNIFKIVKMIMERNFAPVIIFSFSKKDCEIFAMQMAKLDFNTADEKKLVDEVFNNAMDVLSDEDRRLPQVENVLPLLRRGIGIHHGGLLPILKETIEILFGEGLIKALFATETFAMGLNMPARTVLFTAPRKFDGKDFRWISSGEYIQMAGRAGRRGLDDKGIVILMIDEKVSPAVGRDIVQGKADPINSAFHLTYNMVLNLLRVEEINPEYMLERSFYQFQNQAALPRLHDQVEQKTIELNKLSIKDEHNIASYHHIREQLESHGKQFRQWLTRPQYLLPFLQPGRLVKVSAGTQEYDWGIVLNFKKQDQSRKNPLKSEPSVTIDVLLHVSEAAAKSGDTEPCQPNERGCMEVVPVAHTLITQISSIRVYFPNDLRSADNRRAVLKTIPGAKNRVSPWDPPVLNPHR
ncbi:GL15456 [Drosophila persimilis]|uniref:GL15456 n=1 Tax=Drosophila persimilis TaxID=7234 RepID=B4HBZ1_DROPE|nr:GL15456 [Drosophila persimilis]